MSSGWRSPLGVLAARRCANDLTGPQTSCLARVVGSWRGSWVGGRDNDSVVDSELAAREGSMVKKPEQVSKASMAAAASAAVAMLQDPQVREQLVEASSAAAEGIRSWRARRAERDVLRAVEPGGIEQADDPSVKRRSLSKTLTA